MLDKDETSREIQLVEKRRKWKKVSTPKIHEFSSFPEEYRIKKDNEFIEFQDFVKDFLTKNLTLK